jgi:hypothetical protein
LKAYVANQGGYQKLTKPPGNINWPTVTTSQLRNRIADSDSQGKLVDGRCILTLDEEEGMVTWIRAMGKGGHPPKKIAKDSKLKQILELRKRVNNSGGRKAIALSQPANEFMSSGATHARFWSAFANKYGTLLKNAIVRKDDARRMEAAHEGTVDVHFNGEYGVIETARKSSVTNAPRAMATCVRSVVRSSSGAVVWRSASAAAQFSMTALLCVPSLHQVTPSPRPPHAAHAAVWARPKPSRGMGGGQYAPHSHQQRTGRQLHHTAQRTAVTYF